MIFPPGSVIFSESLEQLVQPQLRFFVSHVLCTAGDCRFLYNKKECLLSEGDAMILPLSQLFESPVPSAGFAVQIIAVSPEALKLSSPQHSYGTRGALALYLNPIMHLTAEEHRRCLYDFSNVRQRLDSPHHRFYNEILRVSLQQLYIDFFDFHARQHEASPLSSQMTKLMDGFIDLLIAGHYHHHREVSFYAKHLHVTDKYLSEVSKTVSGYAANYWINRFTSIELQHLLLAHELPLKNIADRFSFSSMPYFTRYVQRHLGASPSAF